MWITIDSRDRTGLKHESLSSLKHKNMVATSLNNAYKRRKQADLLKAYEAIPLSRTLGCS